MRFRPMRCRQFVSLKLLGQLLGQLLGIHPSQNGTEPNGAALIAASGKKGWTMMDPASVCSKSMQPKKIMGKV